MSFPHNNKILLIHKTFVFDVLSGGFIIVIMTREPWPLDGVKFETLKEQHAKRSLEDLEIDYGKSFTSPVFPLYTSLRGFIMTGLWYMMGFLV